MNERLVFQIGLIVKGLDAIAEVVGGILLLAPGRVARWVFLVASHQNARHPHAEVGRLLESLGHSVLAVTAAGAAYLIVHGLAKVVLIAAIFIDKAWGYVGLAVILSMFTAFELVRFATHRSLGLLALAVFDGILVYLIVKEYRLRGIGGAWRPSERTD